jgi:protease-4
MKKIILLVVIMTSLITSVNAQDIRHFTYYDLNPYLQASPGEYRYGLNGFQNPANLAINGMDHFETSLFIKTQDSKIKDFNNIGYFLQSGILGYGMIRKDIDGHKVTNQRISMGIGDRDFSIGLGYGFYSGAKDYFNLENTWQFGFMSRPNKYISFGYSGLWAMKAKQFEHVFEAGVRPIKNYPLTFFADAAYYNTDSWKDPRWSGGISWEVVDGIRLNGRYLSNKTLSLGFDINFGSVAVSAVNNDKNTVVGFRLGEDRSIFTKLEDNKNQFVKIDLVGNYKFNRPSFSFFSEPKGSLVQFNEKIDKLITDKNVKGVLINIDKLSADYATMWEIRTKLEQIKTAGKKIIIFASNLDFKTYHLVSIADKIILDPFGMVSMEGFATGRSYYKKLLAKVGIGYEEIRLFKYKSAVESYTREQFSEGEREQRTKMIDDLYEFARKEIMASRGITEEKFESYVNNSFIYTAKTALNEKLIDGIGRWNSVDSVMKKIDKKASVIDDKWLIEPPEPKDNRWSNKSRKIAIVYAEGACDMETGIKGRELSRIMESVLKNKEIEAVIFRVNSPGGSAMASDYVADVIKKYKGKKPILVSQSSVAASGGYWLSMDADTILATPMTITGSIGVIAGWMYNKGLADTLGITTDLVKRGDHADLAFPFSTPIIPIGLPLRNLSDKELASYKSMIAESYGSFVSLVAKGRKMDSAKVHEVAQGRVWTGISGKEKGLVDIIGGLDKAVSVAKELIKYKPDDDLVLNEYMPTEDFSFLNLLNFVSTKEEISKTQILKAFFDSDVLLRFQNNGKPMMLLPSDYYDFLLNN